MIGELACMAVKALKFATERSEGFDVIRRQPLQEFWWKKSSLHHQVN